MAVSLPFKEDVERWSVEQVTAWLQQREMPEVADLYLRKGIDGHQMLNIPKSKQVAMFWELSVRKRTDVLNIIDQIKTQPTVPHRRSHPGRMQTQKSIMNSTPPFHSLQKTIPVPPNRVASANLTSNVLEVACEELDVLDVPFIDEAHNEDYLVPLSTGAMGLMPHPPPPPLRLKKDRCPSPAQISKDKNKIQSTELPNPPSQKSKTIQFTADSAIKFGSYPTGDEKDLIEERAENKDDLNAYEIIHENPNDLDVKPVDSKDSNDKPPDLPNRNVIPPAVQLSTTPVVPPRTRSASQQHQQNLGSFNPPFRNQAYHHHPTASVQKNHDLNSKNGFNNNLNNTPIPLVLNNQPRQPLVKQIPSPVLTSTNNFSTQPQSLHKPATNFIHSKYAQTNTNLGNLSKGVKLPPPPDIPKAKIISNTPHSASKIQHPTAILNGKAITVSPLKAQTLGLGSGKFVPMNNLYKSLLEEPYFHPVVRNVLPNLLTKDRMFLVRPSTHSQHPLTLSLQEKGKIFNISIRLRSDAKYSLGTEKVGEMAFLSVGDMIEFYRNEPIKLEDGSLTYLKWSPSKEDDYIQPE